MAKIEPHGSHPEPSSYYFPASSTGEMHFMVDSHISSHTPTHDPSTQLQELSEALDAGNINKATRLRNSFTKQSLSTYATKLQAEFHILDERLRKLEKRFMKAESAIKNTSQP